MRLFLNWLRIAGLALALCLAGCATTPPERPGVDYGPYPFDYERIVERTVQERAPSNHQVKRTVTSVSEPMRDVRDDIPGWVVWARVRETRPNAVGGVAISERDWRILLRNGKAVLIE